jgi:hypothetical protein
MKKPKTKKMTKLERKIIDAYEGFIVDVGVYPIEEVEPMQDKPSKAIEKAEALLEYCKAHPGERYWQAIRNLSEYAFIFGGQSTDKSEAEDTFYNE